MIRVQEIIDLVREAIPDATIEVTDLTGKHDHLSLHVVSSVFTGMSLMDRHRLVQKSLNSAMQDGRIHALEIKTETR